MPDQPSVQDSSTLPARRVIDARSGVDARPVNPVTGAALTSADLDRTLHALRGIRG